MIKPMTPHRCKATRHTQAGFSLLELMISLALSLVLAYAFISVYTSSKGASRRLEQLSSLQNSVRTAFDYLTGDVHAVGLYGCYTGKGSLTNNLSPVDLTNNYATPVEGYNATATPSYPLAAASTASNWYTNTATGGINTISFTTLGSTGVTLGSDVLVLRTVGSRPLRLWVDANSVVDRYQIRIENAALGGTCANGSAKVAGFCAYSHALIASCANARAVQVLRADPVGSEATLVLPQSSTPAHANLKDSRAGLASDPTYIQARSEVFPLQTVAYYVRTSSSGTSQSLYRRIFDGDDGSSGTGEEQELIENVETLQVLYGVDTATTNTDGSRDYTVDSYVTANAVTDWARVSAVRVSLLLRANEAIKGDAEVAASASVGGVTVTYPTAGPSYDRRVFTTTVALRNRVGY
jgi:type IV pilus assembly protein PilW